MKPRQPGKGRAAPDFGRLAPLYRWMEWFSFGPCLWWCRTAFLSHMAHAKRALAIGDGDGRFTARLLEVNADVTVDAVDLSPAMLERLKLNAGRNVERVRTTVADASTWAPDDSSQFDLVYTHFFLDCLTDDEVAQLAARLAAVLATGGTWVVSEFAIPKRGAVRLLARPLVAFLYRAFGLLTGLAVRRLPDYRAALRATGLTLQDQQTHLWGILVSERWTRNH